jgi:hypothetical protein
MRARRPAMCICVPGSGPQVFGKQLPDSICSVGGGYITGPAAAEIVVHTFTGKASYLQHQ